MSYSAGVKSYYLAGLLFLLGFGVTIDIFLIVSIFRYPEISQFLKDWQEIIGAALGAAAPLGLYLFTENFFKRKEAYRVIEINNTYGLQTIARTKDQLLNFVERARKHANKDLRQDKIVLARINFPACNGVFTDPAGHQFRIKSYYLHNKLLVFNAWAMDINTTVRELKNDYEKILHLHELLVDLNKEKIETNPKAREETCENFATQIEHFADTVEKITESLEGLNDVALQIRVYNQKLRKRLGFLTRWYLEGMDDFKRKIQLVDKIDSLVQPEVEAEKVNMQQRLEQLKEKENITN